MLLCFHSKNDFCKTSKHPRQKAVTPFSQHIMCTYHVPGEALHATDGRQDPDGLHL